ncbi:DUF948 domain-containing protein [Paenibacillus shirakamiensis]|uniref:DUF948 domain-containing protein n=1 Tax=Paenibacillus shirakamiensis TaxID=1265935 RepID=UPI001AE53611|nr:DUF948 domain-containing protein [Paenibacillus shirakamiensis]
MIWQLSVAVIALAFVALVVFLIKTLKAAENSLDKTSQTLQEVQKTIDELSYEVKQVVRHANGITEDVQGKMKKIDPVLETVKNVGDILNEVTISAKQVSSALIDRFKKSPAEIRGESTFSSASAAKAAVQSPSERTVDSYAAVYSDKKTKQSWVKWVDVAAGVWQRYRA